LVIVGSFLFVVIIGQFYVLGTVRGPCETDPELVVDADGVLTLPAPFERFQPVAWRDS
jgi:hypothetical protein